MAIVIVQPHSSRPPGRLVRVLTPYGQRLDIRRLWLGDPLPPDLDNVDALIVLDSPDAFATANQSPWAKPLAALIEQCHTTRDPLIGVGFGALLIAKALGGNIEANPDALRSWQSLKLTFPGTVETLLAGQPWRSTQILSRNEKIAKLPPGAAPLSTASDKSIQAFKTGLRTVGFVHHIEVEQAGLPSLSVTGDASSHYSEFDRLNTRLIRSLADFLLPASPLQRS